MKRSRRGVILLDMIVAVIMAFAIFIALTTSLNELHKGERNLAIDRAGERRLETAMLALQTGGSPEKEVVVERLPDAAVTGRMWVKLSLPTGENAGVRNLKLVGLVPVSGIKEGGIE